MSDQPESLYVSAKEAGIQVRQTPLTPRERKLQVLLDEAGYYEQGADGARILYDICLNLLDNAEAAPAVPQGWKPINTAPKDKFVLLACPSGYTTTPWVFTTGIMHMDYKAGRWIDHANDDLTDWGMTPMFWRDDVVSPDAATPAALREKQEGGNA